MRRKIMGYLSKSRVKCPDIDLYFDQSVLKSAKELISHYAPQIVIVEYVNCSVILNVVPPGTFKIIDTHDEFSHMFTPEAEAKGAVQSA